MEKAQKMSKIKWRQDKSFSHATQTRHVEKKSKMTGKTFLIQKRKKRNYNHYQQFCNFLTFKKHISRVVYLEGQWNVYIV